MDNHNQNNHEELGYLFNIEILVKDKSNALALQALLQLLNNAENIIDFRINSGIELGSIIESLLVAKKQTFITNSYKRLTATAQDKKKATQVPLTPPAKEKNKPTNPISDNFASMANNGDFGAWIQKHISENRLIRLSVIRNGERTSIPCRILNFIPETYAMNVYHVDEKQVYTFNLSEIIDFIET